MFSFLIVINGILSLVALTSAGLLKNRTNHLMAISQYSKKPLLKIYSAYYQFIFCVMSLLVIFQLLTSVDPNLYFSIFTLIVTTVSIRFCWYGTKGLK